MAWIDPRKQMPPNNGLKEDNAVWIWCKDGVCLGEPVAPDYWWCTEWDAGMEGKDVYGWQPLNRPKTPAEISARA